MYPFILTRHARRDFLANAAALLRRTSALWGARRSGNDACLDGHVACFRTKRVGKFAPVLLSCAIAALSTGDAYAQNIIANPGFETNPPGAFGNNVGYTVSPWILTGGVPNVVKVDGPGGVLYGSPTESGPQSDATLAGAGVRRHYLDIAGSSASFYQAFTVPVCANGATTNSATYTASGYFSTRDRLAGAATMELREGTGLTGAVVAGSLANVVLTTQVTNKTWTFVTRTVTLVPGQTYSYVATMNDGANFDEASLVPSNLQCPGVTLDKTTATVPREVGETLLYSFSATNSSVPAATISNFAVTDAKCASAVTLQSATVTSDNTLQPGETQVYSCTSIPVTQAEYDAGSVSNIVNGSGTPSAGSLGPITDTLITPVSRAADLSIVKSDGVTIVAPGNTVTYTVQARNNSPSAVTGAVVTDAVGAGLTCPAANAVTITGSGVPAGTFTIANLTGAGITLGTLSSGQAATLTYSCQVN